MFPRSLPRAAVRRVIHKERIRRDLSVLQSEPDKASLKGILFSKNLVDEILTIAHILTRRYAGNIQKTFIECDPDV